MTHSQPCMQRYFEYSGQPSYIMASHNPISISKPSLQSWFAMDQQELDCRKSCILPQGNTTGAFTCGLDTFAVEKLKNDLVQIQTHEEWKGLHFSDIQSDLTGIETLDKLIFTSVSDDTKNKWYPRLKTMSFTFLGILTPVLTLVILCITVKIVKKKTKRIFSHSFWCCCRESSYSPRRAELFQFRKSNRLLEDDNLKEDSSHTSSKMLELK